MLLGVSLLRQDVEFNQTGRTGVVWYGFTCLGPLAGMVSCILGRKSITQSLLCSCAMSSRLRLHISVQFCAGVGEELWAALCFVDTTWLLRGLHMETCI